MVGNTSSFVFFCSQEHASLAQSELQHRLQKIPKQLTRGIYVVETTVPKHLERFAYVKQAGLLIASTPLTSLQDFAKHIQNTYKIQLLQDKKYFPSTTAFANMLHEHIPSPQVNLSTPDHEYVVVLSQDHAYLIELLVKNTDAPQLRRAHNKKHLHPTSLHPKLAKAMISLAEAKNFHDPFCGVGGIVLEGLLQKLNATGSDISPQLIQKANENLGENVCFVANATTLQKPAQAYISDLPYGKNSKLSEEKEQLFKKFFAHAKTQTKKLVLGCDDQTPLDNYASGWKLEEIHTVYVHKSLSRKIYVFSLMME